MKTRWAWLGMVFCLMVGAAEPVSTGALLYPGECWMRYADVAEAGFSPEALARARTFWEHRDSSAFLVVSGGAVVAAWGDVDRRFPCHSIRKSLLSALYGVFREDIDLERTLADLDIDDKPPLTDLEKRARIVDLIASRSGVYHEAAAEPDNMSRNRPARGRHKPGSFWWYNNWDFNAAGTVFRNLTCRDIFQAFEDTIAEPIGMQDYRVSDGFYHNEADKSVHPAYMFRMSTRDIARFGLLYARGGRWQDRQIVPASWVQESTRSLSAVDMGPKYGSGYGYMWWIEGMDGFTARGSGGHILAVYPDRDLVMVIRADTFHEQSVPVRACMRLIDMVSDAGRGERVSAPRLVPMDSAEDSVPGYTLPTNLLSGYPFEIKMESGRIVTISRVDDGLAIDYGFGTFRLLPESDTRFMVEDRYDPVLFERDGTGRVSRIWMEQLCYLEAGAAVKRGELDDVVTWLRHAVEKFPESARARFNLARALSATGKRPEALSQVKRALDMDPDITGASWLYVKLQLRRFAWMIGFLVLMIAGLSAFGLVRRHRKQDVRQ